MSVRSPLPIQYLGASGSTHDCVHAMVTILTSSYRCREITIIVEAKHDKEYQAVCFVVWGWLGRDVTIVPDGFGTHGGTGGWGLGLVLSLIEFYQVPIKEKWVEPDMFERIANGHPTRSDIAKLQLTDITAPSWPFWKILFTRSDPAWSAFRSACVEQFPFWLLEPEVLADVQGIQTNPTIAVFRAAKRLEVIIRTAAGFDAALVGIDLINKAMGKDGPFLLKAATESEKQAWEMLFRGMIGAFKNPHSHRDETLTVEDATGQIFAVNALLRKLKKDYPEQFARNELDGDDENETNDADNNYS